MPKFLRRTWSRYPKLGKRRKKKQYWRRPTGRDNKMREKRRGYPAPVSVGYKKEKESSGKIKNMTPVWVKNIKDLEKIKEGKIGILGNIGKRKKIEIAKKAREMKIKFCNINVEKFIKENEKIEKDKEKTKSKEVKNESKKEERTNSQNS